MSENNLDIKEIEKTYNEQKKEYETLINSIIDNITNKIKTPIHSIKYRVKEFESFYNKINRKNYTQPFQECHDLAGIRIITLYKTFAVKIANSIKREFKIVEEVKREIKENEFAYKSIHLIVSLKNNKNNKNTLKNLVCEIQIRTILEESWAEIEHHLNYKHIGVNKETLRKINALSALLEIADEQFEQIYSNFNTEVKSPTKRSKLNPESIYHYSKKIFPWAWKNNYLKTEFEVENINNYKKINKLCEEKRIKTIKELDDIFQKYKEAIEKDDSRRVKEIQNNTLQWPKLYKRVKESKHFYAPKTQLMMALNELN